MIKKFFNKHQSTDNGHKIISSARKSAHTILMEQSPMVLTEAQRAVMTVSCQDTQYIPKVAKAGETAKYRGKEVQIMHNGLQVLRGGYYGGWMEEIIRLLKGHHEPQEEKVFYEVMKRIPPSGGTMIELGSFWAYYSIWFNKAVNKALNICCEPDPANLEVGRENAKLNKASLHFYQALAGKESGEASFVPETNPDSSLMLPIKTVDELVNEHKFKELSILHMDVQGAELMALEGALQTIRENKLRFIFVSTHHYAFSNDPLTHQKCEELIIREGGHIITSHSVLESFSGDGLIVASFKAKDKDFTVRTSVNHSDHSLFRAYERDLDILIKAWDTVGLPESTST